jgi:predicted anti-sigma-YlaC factor YlaD
VTLDNGLPISIVIFGASGDLTQRKLVPSLFNTLDVPLIKKHYDRAVELSRGKSGSIHVAYAEAVSVPLQNAVEFHELIQRAIDVNPDEELRTRLVNVLAQRRARWLAARADQLFLNDETFVSHERTPR